MTTELEVLNLVRGTRSPDAATRRSAEITFSDAALSHPQEFLEALFEIAVSPNSAVDDAQSALLVLKMIVVKHWSAAFEQYDGHPLSVETREYIRTNLVKLVASTPRHLVRNAAALVIARISGYEYPDQWSDLVKLNMQMLASPETLPGGLVLFRELLSETIREQDFFEIAPYVLPRLLEVGSGADTTLVKDAIECFRMCITFLLMGDDDELPQLERAVSGHIPGWIDLFCRLITSADSSQNTELVREILETVRTIDSAFHPLLASHWPHIFWTLVHSLEALDNSSANATLACAECDLLDYALRTNPREPILNSQGSDALPRLMRVCLTMATINDEFKDDWMADYNEFVTFELELSTDLWPRQSVAAIVGTTGQPAVFSLLLEAAHSAQNWQQLESALFLLANVLLQVDINRTDANAQSLAAAVEISERARLSPDAHPLLVARCVLTEGVLAKYGAALPTDRRLKMYMSFLGNLGKDEVVRIAQIKALSMGAAIFPKELKAYQREFLHLINGLIGDAEEDTPAFLVEAFLAALRLDFSTAVKYDEVFQMFFALASKDTADVELNTQIIEFVHELLDRTASDETSNARIIHQLLVPVLQIATQARAPGFEYSADLNFALDLASAILERESISLAEQERNELLEVFYDIVTTTEDPEILQAGSFAYAALVANMPPGFVVSPDTARKILGVAARLLDPELSDSAALASGKLVAAIVNRDSDATVEVLTAAAHRLAKAESALLIESLTLVFCDLVLRNAHAVVDLLAASPGLLDTTMEKWVATFEVIRGADEIHKNIRAFQILYDLHDPRLDSIMINDKPIIDPNRILTRSRAKNLQFTKIPLPLKIIKLLIKELAQQPAMSEPSLDNQDDDGDSEWEEEIGIGTDGDLVDYRNFRLIINWFKQVGQDGMQWFPQLSGDERRLLMDATKR